MGGIRAVKGGLEGCKDRGGGVGAQDRGCVEAASQCLLWGMKTCAFNFVVNETLIF